MVLPNISLRELQFLRETIISGSATRAAARLGVSQPAVSRALSRLEERLDVTLFSRTDRRLVPTPAAFALNEELDPVFTSLENVGQFSDGSVTSEIETLRIIAPITFSIMLIQPLISSFMKRHPQARFQLEVGSSQECVKKIALGEADIGISNSQAAHEGIHFDSVIEMDAVCVMLPDNPLAEKSVIRPKDIEGLDLIAMSKSMSSRFKLDNNLEKAGVSANIIAEVTASYTACQFVEGGMGIAVINPFPTLIGGFENLVARPFLPSVKYSARVMSPASVNQSWIARNLISEIIEQSNIRWQQSVKQFNLSVQSQK